MAVSFNPLKADGQLFTHLPELDDVELSLSNANAVDVLDALGIEDAISASPWPLPCFKALLVVARRKRIGHASPAIPLTGTPEPRLHGPDRLRQARRLHRAEARPSLGSRKPRSRVGRDPYRVGLKPSLRPRTSRRLPR